jgi:ribosomal protein L32
MSERELGTYQMLWDCSTCGTSKLLGLTHRHCPNCGAAQDEEKRYFPSDEDKVAVEDHRYVGADKECEACGSPMGAACNNCTNCGAGLDGAAEVGRVPDGAPPPPPKQRSGPGRAIAIGVVVVIALLVVFFGWKKPIDATATGKAWSREIDVEVYGPVQRSEWCDRMPSAARDVRRAREVRDHRQIPDGETCTTARKDNGDGTFSEFQKCSPKFRQEPIYDDKCTFTVDAWPDPGLTRPGKCVGCEQAGSRREAYTVTFERAGGGPFDCPFPEARWASIEVGSAWSGTASVISGGASCSALQPK